MKLFHLLEQNPVRKSVYVSGTNGYKRISKIPARSTVAVTNHALQENQNDPAKSFKDIPGPKGLPLVGNLWDIYKNKRYYLIRTHELFALYSKQYGSIFKYRIGHLNTVFISKPEDVAKVFQAEGQYGNRGDNLVLPLIIYREQYKKPKGILISKDEDWRASRSVLDKKLLKMKDVKAYSSRMNDVITDMIHFIERKKIEDKLDGEILNLKDCFYKWSFETINTVIYNKRLGAFDDPPAPIAEEFYNAVYQMIERTGKLRLLPPYYKYIKTRYWKEYCGYWNKLFDIGGKLVTEERHRLQELAGTGKTIDIPQDLRQTEELEFLPYVIARGELSDEKIACNIVELMTAGVDTSANSVLSTMYILGKNPDIQEKLYQEVKSVIDNKGQFDSDGVQRMPYLRGLIKESQRIYPVVQGIPRILAQDTILSGYLVPANTLIVIGSYIMSFDKSLHDEPEKVKPERWFRSSEQKRHPFGFLPFGFGPRSCIGRRIAELEMKLLIARLVYQYRLDCRNTEKMSLINRLIMTPEKDIRIAFHSRNLKPYL